MATGGIALVLSVQPRTFRGLTVLGDIVFILDLVLFLSFGVRLPPIESEILLTVFNADRNHYSIHHVSRHLETVPHTSF